MGAFFGVALAAVIAWSAASQEQTTASDEGVVVYDEAFFSRYTLTNAEDLLRRIPGASTILDTAADEGSERGFGSSGSQVLIDGQRMAGKSNDIIAALRRIRASRVERVELIRGTAAGVDVQSEGVIINVVLRSAAGTGGSGAFEINTKFNEERSQGVDGLLSYSGALGGADYTLGVRRDVWAPLNPGSQRWSDAERRELRVSPAGVPLEYRPEDWSRDYDRYDFTGSLSYTFAEGEEIRLNGLYRRTTIEEIIVTPIQRFQPDGSLSTVAVETLDRLSDPIDLYEAGGEYVRPLAGGSARLLFLVRRDQTPLGEERVSEMGASRRDLGRTFRDRSTGEDILRGSYSRSLWTGQTLELGGEIVRNTLEQDLEAAFDLNQDGALEDIVIPVAHAEVEEQRGEGYAKHNWEITSALTLESMLTFERSQITTNYPFTPEQTYEFLKPRFDLRWRPSAADVVRVTVERTASQLNFNEFVPTYDYINDEIDAGNPELAPETTWIYEAAYEHRLPSDNGVIEARVFYNDISDHIDQIVIGFDDENGNGVRDDPRVERLISAAGNIPQAERYGFEIDASLRLTMLGLPDAVVTTNYLKQDSELIDPFSGVTRKIRMDWDSSLTLGLRHDVNSWGLSYGGEYVERGGAMYNSDVFLLELFEVRPRWDAFVEKKLSERLSLRVEALGFTASEELRERTRYADDATIGTISRIDAVREIRDRRFVVGLRGS